VRNASNFDAVFYPGGHGPLWDLAEDAASIALIDALAAAGKPVAAVCHAPGVLRHARNPAGEPLLKGKNVTGFTNTEEEAAGLTKVVPLGSCCQGAVGNPSKDVVASWHLATGHDLEQPERHAQECVHERRHADGLRRAMGGPHPAGARPGGQQVQLQRCAVDHVRHCGPNSSSLLQWFSDSFGMVPVFTSAPIDLPTALTVLATGAIDLQQGSHAVQSQAVTLCAARRADGLQHNVIPNPRSIKRSAAAEVLRSGVQLGRRPWALSLRARSPLDEPRSREPEPQSRYRTPISAPGNTRPPRTVPQTAMSRIAAGLTSCGSRSSTVKSASLPGSRLPTLSSMPRT